MQFCLVPTGKHREIPTGEIDKISGGKLQIMPGLAISTQRWLTMSVLLVTESFHSRFPYLDYFLHQSRLVSRVTGESRLRGEVSLFAGRTKLELHHLNTYPILM